MIFLTGNHTVQTDYANFRCIANTRQQKDRNKPTYNRMQQQTMRMAFGGFNGKHRHFISDNRKGWMNWTYAPLWLGLKQKCLVRGKVWGRRECNRWDGFCIDEKVWMHDSTDELQKEERFHNCSRVRRSFDGNVFCSCQVPSFLCFFFDMAMNRDSL